MKYIPKYCAILATSALVASCSVHKKVPYVQDAELIPAEVLSVPVNTTDPILQPGDLLNIEVSASNYTAVAPFNKGRYVDPETGGLISAPRNTSTNGSGAASLDYYLVDKDGNITFPIVGPLHVAGLTKTQAQGLVAEAICPKYLKELPVVDIRFVNFRVTVLGAVSSPGIKKSENESLNIFEAIAMAGDLDIKADRENIVLIRTNSDGAREVHKLNVHDKDMLLSPYYNLQPNDLLLVNWNRSGAQNAWQMNQAFTTTLTVVGGVSAVLGLTLSIINLAD